MLRLAVPVLLLLLMVVSAGAGHLESENYVPDFEFDDVAMGDTLGIGLMADDPVRDRLIAGLAVIVLVGSIFVAIYYIARKEGL